MTPARRVRAGLAALALGAIAAAAPAAAQAAFTKGASGGGDPYFPRAGNGGYDVSRYNLHLRYEPRTNRLVAKAIVHARAEKGLSRFDLDFRHLHVKRVTVNGDRARYSRRGQELKITPRHGLKKGIRFNVRVRYRGHPRPVIDPDGASDGWIRTDDGAFVAAEPQGAPTWFPCNDLLTDKARYRIRVTVPRGKAAISNGELVKSVVHGRNRTFVWEENAPMATYLATVTTGDFDVSRSRANGVPSLVAIDPRESAAAPTLRRLPAMLRLFEPRFGDYPFGATGGTVDHAPNVGYALETQTRPIFDTAPDSRTVAHELAHQWFGDSVSLRRWRQIWLNEGFATWAEWYWVQHNGGETTAQVFNRIYSRHGPNEDSFWNPPPGDPGGPQNLFDSTIYVRGGMTLEALRQEVGTETLFRILDDWTRQHAYANAGTKQFIELAEADSGRDLGRFFHIWLYRSGKPRGWRGTAATHAGRAALEPAGGVMRSIGRLR